MGEPHVQVAKQIQKSSGLFSHIFDILKPGMRVADLIASAHAYYEENDLWEDRGWVSGY